MRRHKRRHRRRAAVVGDKVEFGHRLVNNPRRAFVVRILHIGDGLAEHTPFLHRGERVFDGLGGGLMQVVHKLRVAAGDEVFKVALFDFADVVFKDIRDRKSVV
jgi:hypothetical protein